MDLDCLLIVDQAGNTNATTAAYSKSILFYISVHQLTSIWKN